VGPGNRGGGAPLTGLGVGHTCIHVTTVPPRPTVRCWMPTAASG